MSIKLKALGMYFANPIHGIMSHSHMQAQNGDSLGEEKMNK